MYGKLNIREIYKGHLNSFRGANGLITTHDKRDFIYLPIIASITLSIWNLPNESIKNVLAICLSILIGLLLNILVLILSNIESDKYKLSFPQRKIRLELIEETFNNISFSVIISVYALLLLFLMDILTIKDAGTVDFFYIFFENNINIYIQFILSCCLYFFSIQIFLVLFMIIKRIGKIFSHDIKFEIEKTHDEEKTHIDN